MIMVDELAFPDRRGRIFCHMTSDSDDKTELHQFAIKIGLKRCWFHASRSAPHYDLTKLFRDRAIAQGAVFVRAVEQAVNRMRKRAEAKP